MFRYHGQENLGLMNEDIYYSWMAVWVKPPGSPFAIQARIDPDRPLSLSNNVAYQLIAFKENDRSELIIMCEVPYEWIERRLTTYPPRDLSIYRHQFPNLKSPPRPGPGFTQR